MKFTRRHANQVRAAARIEVKTNRVSVEAGTRFNINTHKNSINIAAISDDPEWNDTDLNDYRDLKDLIGTEIEEKDGKVHIDFYIYLGPDRELESNVDLIWQDGKLVAANGTTNKNILSQLEG